MGAIDAMVNEERPRHICIETARPDCGDMAAKHEKVDAAAHRVPSTDASGAKDGATGVQRRASRRRRGVGDMEKMGTVNDEGRGEVCACACVTFIDVVIS